MKKSIFAINLMIMWQRIQTIFLLIASLISLLIFYYDFKVFINITDDNEFFRLSDCYYASSTLLLASISTIYVVFKFSNLKNQLLFSSICRLLIIAALVQSFIFYRNQVGYEIHENFYYLLIPLASLFAASFFIKKDINLINSSDRIR